MPPPKKTAKVKPPSVPKTVATRPSPPKDGGSKPPESRASVNMVKVSKQGILPAPEKDYPLPHPDSLAGTPRERIAIMCKAMCEQDFIIALNKSQQFEVRACDYRDGPNKPPTHLHFGECFVFYTPVYCTNPHPFGYLIISPSCVKQWHLNLNGELDIDNLPNYLLSLENYMLYVFLQLKIKIPEGVMK